MATELDADRALALISTEERSWRAGLPYLLTMAQAGEHEAWEALYIHYRGLIYSVCLDWMRDVDAAEDHASATWERAYTRIEQFDANSNFVAWLCRIAVNACRDTLRRGQVLRIIDIMSAEVQEGRRGETSGHGGGAGDMSLFDFATDEAPGPEDAALRMEAAQEARETLARGLRSLQAGCDAARQLTRNYAISVKTARQVLAADLVYGVECPHTIAERSQVIQALVSTGMGRKVASYRLWRARRAMRLAIEMTGGWGGAA